MDWTTCDASLLIEAFNGIELAKVTQARGQGEADPVPGICAGIAARCRAAAAASGKVDMSGTNAGQIPAALRNEATALLRHKLLVRYDLEVTEERRLEAQAAEERLERIARGETPLLDDTVQTIPTYHARPPRWKSPIRGGLI